MKLISCYQLENKRPNPESEEHKPKAKVKYVKRAKAEFDPMSRTITRDQREANLVAANISFGGKLIIFGVISRKRSILLLQLVYTSQKTR